MADSTQADRLPDFIRDRVDHTTGQVQNEWIHAQERLLGIRDQLRAVRQALDHAGADLEVNSHGGFSLVYDAQSPAELHRAIEESPMELAPDEPVRLVFRQPTVISMQVTSVEREADRRFRVKASIGNQRAEFVTPEPPSVIYTWFDWDHVVAVEVEAQAP